MIAAYASAADALAEAQKMARLYDEPHVVLVRVARNRATFESLMLTSFDTLRERGTVGDIAVFAVVKPREDRSTGEPVVEIAAPFQLFAGDTNV